ncbi:TonB-dependent siderophore myxochelin receptor MxcH [Hyalangium versicolor]|uniref:TonB-dependent siderophore myxochelin receptor MxcH n=1 Tax=Hyalangium versicolor TaxID=2861190 RepID=UPI001CCABEDF|nr:TonB-dependent siderophore myxochelin receptor MxcH [Hyalangium versicolor]
MSTPSHAPEVSASLCMRDCLRTEVGGARAGRGLRGGWGLEFLVLVAVISMGFSARAQQAAGAPPATGLEPPTLVEPVEPNYPEDARAQRLEGVVSLRLSIDPEGHVTAAEVTEPLGNSLDEAAREAALRLRFNPARRDGQPIAARILYRMTFRLPPEPTTGSVTAQVLDASGAPKAAIEVSLSGPELATARAVTDAEGRVQFPELAPGQYRLQASSSAGAVQSDAVVVAGSEARIELRLPAELPPAAPSPVEVTVRGTVSEARQRQESAEAVNVVDLRRAREQSADLGEVVARTQGVAVRRSGGLGSGTRFSLNGLYDDQIRFFLDGVPLELAGYPFGFANVPVNLIDRVEIFRGVVPIRFGADALGGAVNLVTDQDHQTRLGASYQAGSFGTHRVTLDGRYRHDPTGFVAGGAAFFDFAQNDYRINVEVPDDRGRLQPVTVPRFHDGYRAFGGSVEVGVVDRPWARQLLLRAFGSTYDKDLQHNLVMTVPYGEPTYGETVLGATARYEQPLSSNLELSVLGNFARRTIDFVDKGEWVYDWFGHRIRERAVAGEIESEPTDQTIWQNSGLGRVGLEWVPHGEHVLRLSMSPTYVKRTGDERIQADPSARDPLTARRNLFTFVSGIEYELNALPIPGASSVLEERRRGTDYAVQNTFFVKDYVYRASSEEALPGGNFRPLSQDSHALGIGDGVRVRLTEWFYAKASYEYATRLPRPDEVFGNGVLISPSLELEPEVSHNANLGPHLEMRRASLGDFTVDLNAFWRDSSRLIVLLGNDRYFTYQNVYRARALGIESAVAWSSPGRWLSLDGMVTFQDVRNASSEGTFGDFEGDRIPNRPWLFASWGARVRIPGLPGRDDTLEPFYAGRYVHSFYRSWESQGLRDFKQVVDSQLTHNLGLSWSMKRDARFTTTLEVQNLTDAAVYDFFGVQRPGRSIFLKVTGEI